MLIAAAAVYYKYRDYIVNPWTRNGQVRAEIIQITPRVSGPIVKLPIRDNGFVSAGDLLFEVDPRTFEANLAKARAQYDMAKDNIKALEKQVEAAKARVEASSTAVLQARSAIKETESLIEKSKADYERQKDLLPKRATSQKALDLAKASYEISLEKREGALAGLLQAQAGLRQAEAALAETEAKLGAPGEANAALREAATSLREAELDLEFTRVVAPVDGYVTNLNLRKGSNAAANQPALALVDVDSFWIDAYFKETSIAAIKRGNKAIVTLMAYSDDPLEGYVDSIGWGIAQKDGSTGYELLPNVSPTFEWIRLAQRTPVKIFLSNVPGKIELRVGTTASVLVMSDTETPIRDIDRSANAKSGK